MYYPNFESYGNQTLSVPLKTQVYQRWAIQLIPLLIGLGMATAIGTRIASLLHYSTTTHSQRISQTVCKK